MSNGKYWQIPPLLLDTLLLSKLTSSCSCILHVLSKLLSCLVVSILFGINLIFFLRVKNSVKKTSKIGLTSTYLFIYSINPLHHLGSWAPVFFSASTNSAQKASRLFILQLNALQPIRHWCPETSQSSVGFVFSC